MTAFPSEVPSLYAYLTVAGDLTSGLVGGALVVDGRGRPVEFHCTDTLTVSRAEQILYGTTLETYLFCDRIAASIMPRLGKVAMVLVDRPELCPLARELSLPVVFVPRSVLPETASEGQAATFTNLSSSPQEDIEAAMASLQRYIPLDEPFERIVEALREAGHMAPRGEVPHDLAA